MFTHGNSRTKELRRYHQIPVFIIISSKSYRNGKLRGDLHMTTKKFFCGVLAAAFALSLAGVDIASAQYGSCGQGQGGGRGACVQNDQSQTYPNYQGQGRRRGRQGRQQRLRDGSCVNNPNTQSPNPAPVPAPSN
jgi:hypothetical protein